MASRQVTAIFSAKNLVEKQSPLIFLHLGMNFYLLFHVNGSITKILMYIIWKTFSMAAGVNKVKIESLCYFLVFASSIFFFTFSSILQNLYTLVKWLKFFMNSLQWNNVWIHFLQWSAASAGIAFSLCFNSCPVILCILSFVFLCVLVLPQLYYTMLREKVPKLIYSLSRGYPLALAYVQIIMGGKFCK